VFEFPNRSLTNGDNNYATNLVMKKKAMHHIIYPQNIEQAEDEKMCSLMQKKTKCRIDIAILCQINCRLLFFE
jgi:hypothetical protein